MHISVKPSGGPRGVRTSFYMILLEKTHFLAVPDSRWQYLAVPGRNF